MFLEKKAKGITYKLVNIQTLMESKKLRLYRKNKAEKAQSRSIRMYQTRHSNIRQRKKEEKGEKKRRKKKGKRLKEGVESNITMISGRPAWQRGWGRGRSGKSLGSAIGVAAERCWVG